MKKIGLLSAAIFFGAAALFAEGLSSVPFGFDLDLSYEYRWQPSGGLLIEDTAIKSGAAASGADLERDYFDRAPFARLAFGYGGPAGFSLALEMTVRNGWTGNYEKADNLPFIWDTGSTSLAGNVLSRGVVYWKSPVFDFALGRDSVDYGGFLYGSLLPSSRLPYLDNARARLKLGKKFKIDWMVATIQAVESWDGIDVEPNAKSSSTTELSGSGDTTGPYGFESWSNPTTIWEVMNRYSWKIGGDFILGVTDHAVIARRNNQFSLCDIFPLTSRHQSSVGETNNSLVFDAAWRPLQGLDLAAQFGLDDINGNDIGISDTGSPTIPAFVAGARYRAETQAGALSAQAEAGYTNYLWGNYDATQVDPEAGVVDTLARMQYRFLASDGEAILLPLTSPYGPGALWCKAGGSISLGSSGFTLGADLLYLAKNPEANLIDTQLYDNTSTGSAAYVHYLEISLPTRYQSRSWIVGLSPALLWREGDYSFELTFLASYRLRSGDRDPDAGKTWASPQADLE
jgi:hypothetical protein